MRYTLMHKTVPVAELSLDEVTGSIQRIVKTIAPEHVPVGVVVKRTGIDRAGLNEWWMNRSIPASRQGIWDALEELNLPDTTLLLEKSFGLSLSDQYWICPADTPIKWGDINFFENSFSEDVGDILFGKGRGEGEISLMSPDNTSDGWLRKKWTISDGKRCLIKGGSGANRQEPYNEAFASNLMERLGIPHVEYALAVQDGYPVSICEDFITAETELVSAWYIMQTRKKENHVSVYQHYLDCCEALGVQGVTEAIDRMLVLDFLIVNEDRHQNNFGAVRSADTLEWIGPAPIYDSGTSLWLSTPVSLIRPDNPKLPSKPFKSNHNEQIKLASSFDWIDFKALEGIDSIFRDIVGDSPFVDVPRRDALCDAIRRRVVQLADIVNERRTHRMVVPDWSAEVQEDVAYSGDDEEDEMER